MADNTKARENADERFKKAQKADVARRQAMAEYEAASEARKVKTAKLKALRLAKEEEDQTIEAAKPAAPKKRTRKAAAK